MLSKWILIRNSVGLHARPVFQLASAASDYQSDIRICHHGLAADAKNSARLLALGINTGEVVNLIVDGIDEVSPSSASTASLRISTISNLRKRPNEKHRPLRWHTNDKPTIV